eukprot:TRINITY_DN112617_c0_g1_i1.p1 TRINITY_DN112617_c0_g1~~TRINITY_DN112617_c0_g1_i1.p1  ORF type:complete len:110 (+),score=10.31 TRINITY_DN112617_c0_g1_i1:63-392(+)
MPPAEAPEDSARFQQELEFVQLLSCPDYLRYLAQRRFFRDTAFLNFLEYLLYWRREPYLSSVQYPQCLQILEWLQREDFRLALENERAIVQLRELQSLAWLHHGRIAAD